MKNNPVSCFATPCLFVQRVAGLFALTDQLEQRLSD